MTQTVTHLEILVNVWQVEREEADDPEGCAEEDRQGGEKQLKRSTEEAEEVHPKRQAVPLLSCFHHSWRDCSWAAQAVLHHLVARM